MKVLAAITAGGVGDLLAALPAIQALHRHFAIPVDVLATAYAAPIIQGQPAVGTILTTDGRASAVQLAERLRPREYTHAIAFWSNPQISSALQRARIPQRIGQSRRLYSYRYTTRVTVRTETGDNESHWTDVQMDYARALGVRPRAEDYRIAIAPTDADQAQVQAVFQSLDLRQPYVMLHAVRGVSAHSPHWPNQRFAMLGDALSHAFEAPIVLTGGENERDLVQRIADGMKQPAYNAAGLSTLRGIAALAQGAHAVVALDSGPMHIAAAAGAPTVGVFALRTDLPDRWRPLGARVAVVGPSYPCPRGCRKETCRTFACYAELALDEVVAAARSVALPAEAKIAL